MTINERIRAFRKDHLKINQAEFAAKLGITQSGLSLIERGGATVTNGNLKLLCSTYSLSEEWLRTGKGDMFAGKTPEAAFEDYLKDCKLDGASIKFVKAFIELPQKERSTLLRCLNSMIREDDAK